MNTPAPFRPARPFGRTLADFHDYIHTDGQPLYPAERKLLAACRRGEPYVISEERPQAATDENTIRGPFLRFLALGGDDENPVHESGFGVAGVWIAGSVNFSATRLVSNFEVKNSVFAEKIDLADSHVTNVSFSGSLAKEGLIADRLNASGSIHLTNNFKSYGEVSFFGANIRGQINFQNSKFYSKNYCKKADNKKLHAKENYSIMCDKIDVKGNFILGGKDFVSEGEIRLASSKIGGQINFNSGIYNNKDGVSLQCQGMQIGETFFFKTIQRFNGTINLVGASCKSLSDDKESWNKLEKIYIDNFNYNRIARNEIWSIKDYIIWLQKDKSPFYSDLYSDDSEHVFHPQPWKHLISVLRNTGMDRAADKIAFRLRRKLRKSYSNKKIEKYLIFIWEKGAAYGYKPFRLIKITFFVWIFCSLCYKYCAINSVFSPTNPLIFDSPRYAQCRTEHLGRKGIEGAGNWTTCLSPAEYTTFNAWVYSLDLILPLVDLQQDKDWAPMVTEPTPAAHKKAKANTVSWSVKNPAPQQDSILGYAARGLLWFEILFGWVVSLLFVGSLSGLVRNVEKE